ncbi:MAG: phage protein GemA/Gp16 family protein [Pseudomonadota bacterium]
MSDLRALQRQIHGACRQLGYDAEMRRDVQIEATGKASMKDFKIADYDAMKRALKARGWKPGGHAKSTKPRWRKEAKRADQRFIYVLWRLLADAGVVAPGAAALRGFISSNNFADKWGEAATAVEMLSVERAYDVIEALKALCHRHGVEIAR